MITTWVTGIATLLGLIKELVEGVKVLSKFIEDNKNEAWFQESAKVFATLRAAKTPEERQNVAKNLRDLFSGIGK